MADLADPHRVSRQGPRRFRSNRNTKCEESDCGCLWTWGGGRGRNWVDGVLEQEIKQAQCWAWGQIYRKKAVLLSRRACTMVVKLLAMVARLRGAGGLRGGLSGLAWEVPSWCWSRYRFGRGLKTGSSAPAALALAWDGGRHWDRWSDGVVSSCCLGEVGGDHVEPLLPRAPLHSAQLPPGARHQEMTTLPAHSPPRARD